MALLSQTVGLQVCHIWIILLTSACKIVIVDCCNCGLWLMNTWRPLPFLYLYSTLFLFLFSSFSFHFHVSKRSEEVISVVFSFGFFPIGLHGFVLVYNFFLYHHLERMFPIFLICLLVIELHLQPLELFLYYLQNLNNIIFFVIICPLVPKIYFLNFTLISESASCL